jgi:hypothetical protein
MSCAPSSTRCSGGCQIYANTGRNYIELQDDAGLKYSIRQLIARIKIVRDVMLMLKEGGRMRKRRSKGGQATDRFVAFPHYMLRSVAWRALSPVARAIYIEVLVLYNGSNNGYLALSSRDAAMRARCSKDTASRAFAELQRAGFLELSIQGAFHRKDRHASQWRVTHRLCDRTGELGSKAFERWTPPGKTKTRSDDRDRLSL